MKRAHQQPMRRIRHALIISNTYYTPSAATLPPLPNGDANYTQMKEYAQARGFDSQVSGFCSTLGQLHLIIQRFAELLRATPDGDVCLFYFSGYGARIGGRNLIMSDDGKYLDLESEYLALLDPSLHRSHILVLDCVAPPGVGYSGAFAFSAPPLNCFLMDVVMDDYGDDDDASDALNTRHRYNHCSPMTNLLVQSATAAQLPVEQLAKVIRVKLSNEEPYQCAFATSTLMCKVML